MTFPTSFAKQGFAIAKDVINPADCEAILQLASVKDSGSRSMLMDDWCQQLARALQRHPLIATHLPEDSVAVQCTLFEKSADKNWLVPVHQDLSIPVAERVESPALRGWSSKEGGIFVQPPPEVLSELVAVRLHLDPCGTDDGPMIVVPGSHSRGVISTDAAAAARAEGETACPVDAAGILIMRPLLLHRSSKSTGTSRRRVLHFLFDHPILPFGLRWKHAIA